MLSAWIYAGIALVATVVSVLVTFIEVRQSKRKHQNDEVN